MKKRIVAILMSLMMLAGSAPVSLFAASPAGATGSSAAASTEQGTAGAAGTGQADPAAGEAAQAGNATGSTEQTSTAADPAQTAQPTTETTTTEKGTETASSTEAETETETETEEKELTEEEKWLDAHGLHKNADGMYEYTDENGVLWTYDPEDPELFRLFSDEKDLDMEFVKKRGSFSAKAEEDPYYWRLNGNFRFRYPTAYATDSIENRAVVHYGLDVSSHQGVIPASSWETLSSIYGIDFVFIRAGYRGYGESGSINTDPQAVANIQNAAKAGLAVGVYYFSQAITTQEAVAEADDCMRIIAPYKDLITLPVVIDYEYAGTGLGRLANANLSKQAHTDIVNAFCKRVQDNGYTPGIYANVDMLTKDMVLSGIPAEYKIWMANWPAPNSEGIIATKYADRLSAWQYTGSFTGFGSGTGGAGLFKSEKVDLNFWYGDFEEQETFTEAKITSAKAVSTPDPKASATDTRANKIISVEVEAELPGKMKGSDGKVYLATVNQVTGELEYVIPSSGVDYPSKSETITISVPLDNDFKTGYYRQCEAIRVEGGANKAAHLRLYLNKLALAVKNEDGTYSAVSEGRYVSNPEVISYTSDYQATSSKKGIQSADHIVGEGIDATTGLANNDLGVSHVFLNLYISDVMDAANGPLGAYEYNGEKYFFSSLGSYLNTIRRCNDAGIGVTLQVMLDDPSNITDPAGTYNKVFQQWMIHSKAQKATKTLYSWENGRRDHREVIEAAFSYIGEAFGTLAAKDLGGQEGKPVPERESTQVFVSDWVLGNEVNSCDAWQYRGDMTDDEFFESYAQTYRTFYNAIKSVNAGARVYLCTDNAWNQRVAGFTAKETVDRVAGLLHEYDPTTDWNLAFHPYPHPLGATAFWTNADVTGAVSTPFINMSNLKVLTDYISNTYGSSHRIILSEQGFSSGNGENMQAAALVHAYYLAATNPMIDAFEIRSYEDEKLEILQGTTMGLTTRKNNGYVMKEAYSAYKYCDDPRPEAKKFMDEHAYYKVVNSGATGWGDVSNPYYDAGSFDNSIYRTVPEPPAEPEEPEEPPAASTYTVSFYMNGGAGNIASQTVTSGETAEKPADPTRSGYTFTKWVDPEGAEYDFSAPVQDNLTLKALWEAKTDTPYTVEHYKANVDGSYPKTPAETEKVTGTTDTDTAAAAKTYEGFTAQDVKQQKISGDGETVVKIYYARKQVTLWFDSKGGTAIDELKAPYDSPVSKPADPEKKGHAFKGWDPAIPARMPSEDLTLTAQWQVNSYTVTFDTAGGSPSIASQTVEYQEKAQKPEDPKRVGYDFVQWLDAKGNGYDFDTEVTGDLALTAQWSAGETGYAVEHYLEKANNPGEYAIDADATIRMRGTTGTKTAATSKTYAGFTPEGVTQQTILADGSTVVKIYYKRNLITLQFCDEDGATLSTLRGSYGQTLTIPDSPQRDGYTFTGWGQSIPSAFPSEDQVYTATWTPNTDTPYTVRHYRADLNGIYPESLCETETGRTGTTGTATMAAARSYDGFTAQTVQQKTISGDGRTVVKIYYTRNQTTLHFDSRGGTPVNDCKGLYDSVVAAPADPVRTGYSFLGWSPSVPEKMPLSDQTFTAQWKIDTYQVKFDTAGSSATIPAQSVAYQEQATKPADPEKQGYTFVQWLDESGKGYDFHTPVTGDLTLTAQWTEGKTGYTVEHYLDKIGEAGSYELDATVKMTGTTGQKTEAVAKTYTGFVAKSFVQEKIASDGSTTVKIYYNRNTVTLRFLGEGQKPVATLTGAYQSKVNAPDDPDRTGYRFTGWDSVIPETFPAEDAAFTATWEPVDCTVKFFDEDGTLLGAYVLKYDTPSADICVPPAPRKEKDVQYSYTFRGWTPELQTVTGDISYQASYDKEENAYQVTFTDGLGKSLASSEVVYGNTPKVPADPGRTGYTFRGYTPAITPVTGDQTYRATWEPVSYQIIYDLAGGENAATNPTTYTVESTEITFATPKKTGYNFEKWVDENGRTISSIPSGSTGDRKVKAVWTKAITYAINYDLAGGQNAPENPAYYTVESPELTLAAPKRTGYTFIGWTGEDQATPSKTVTIPAKSTGERKYTANWSRNSYTLKIDKADGSANAVTTTTVPYGDPITKPANPSRDGFEFTGWDVMIPSTMPDRDLTATAQWKVKTYQVSFVDANGNTLQSENVEYGKNTSYTGKVPTSEGKLFIGWSLNGQPDITQLKQLHDTITSVKQEYRYQAVYTDAPTAPVTLESTEDPVAGEKNETEVSNSVALDERETTALQAFDSTRLTPSLVKQEEVLAAVASACAQDGKTNAVQTITNIALEIKTEITGKSGNGKQAVYVLEISPYAVAKNGGTTVVETKLDHEALQISDSNRMQVKIPVLMNILFAKILHYMDDNSTVRETFNVPVQTSNGERFATVSLGCFSRFTVQEGTAAPATVTPGAGGSGNTAGSAAAGQPSVSASAPLAGEAIPSPELTFAQKAAIEMAALQEKVASGGSWIGNLFHLGNQEAAAADHAAAPAQNGSGAASHTAEVGDAAEGDESSGRAETTGEETDMSDALRTADAGEVTESGTDAVAATVTDTADNTGASADNTTHRQKETKSWMIPLIVILTIACAVILAGLLVLRTRSHKKRHQKRK